MDRRQRYATLTNRVKAMKLHAIEKGDGIQADKCRKILLDIAKLLRTDESDMSGECE